MSNVQCAIPARAPRPLPAGQTRQKTPRDATRLNEPPVSETFPSMQLPGRFPNKVGRQQSRAAHRPPASIAKKRFDISPSSTHNRSVLKLVYCVRRRADVSPEAFRKYWLESHGPLVRKHAHALGAQRYVQSHTLDSPLLNAAAQQPRGSKSAYDGITEVWWESQEALTAALSTPQGESANRALAEDEGRFCDLPNCSVFFTEEHTIF